MMWIRQCYAPWQLLWPDQIKDLLRSHSTAFLSCSLSRLLSDRPPYPPHMPISSGSGKKRKRKRSDLPGGKRWQMSTCSPSAHCPLQLPGPWKQIRWLIFNSSILLVLLVRELPSQQLPRSLSIQQCTDQWSYALCIATGQPHIHHLQWEIKFSSTTQTNQTELITKSLYWFSPFFLFPQHHKSHTNPSLAFDLVGDHNLFKMM